MIKSSVTLMMLSYIDDVEQLTGLAAGRLFSEGGDGYMSIKKIAEKAGVSPATVSRVLNNPNYKCSVSGLRDKIWKTAIEMNYVPNEAARNLKKGVSAKQEKTWYINILMTRTDSSTTDPFFAELLRVIESEIHDKNCILSKVWYMSVFSDDRKCRRENLDRLIDGMYDEVEGKRDGLIIIGMLSSDYLSLIERNIKVPYICLDFYDRKHEFDAVITDNFYGMYKLVNYLFEMGHKKIAYVGTLLSTNSITDRYMGYYKAMLEHGQEVPADYVIDDRSKDTRARRINYDFVLPKDMPTAFACNNDVTAIDLIGYLKQKGYRVPEDISIVGFDNYQVPGRGDLDITTYEVDIKEMARKTINNLLKKIVGEHYKKGITTVEGHMVIKTSVKKL